MGFFGQSEPHEAQVGIDLTCEVCGNNTFWEREAQLNTPVGKFFNLDWTNPSATCLVCSQCGYIHWFLPLE